MMKIDDDTIFNPFVFKQVFQPKFIGKSSKLPIMIGSSTESNSVRYLNIYPYIYRYDYNTLGFISNYKIMSL